MTDHVSVERTGRVAVVRFDRGVRANPLSQALMMELTQAACAFHDCPDISAVILTGRSDCFSMGADLKDAAIARRSAQGLGDQRIALRTGPRLCQAWEDVDALTICAVEGWCVGGGVALASACDLRVAARNSVFYVPEVERGMNMSWGSIPRFTALIGPARTKRMAALCEKIDGHTAHEWGLADYLSEDGAALPLARSIADQASTLPPTALKVVKHDVNVAAHALHRATAHRDLEAFALLSQSEDYAEAVAAFLEKRDAAFTGD